MRTDGRSDYLWWHFSCIASASRYDSRTSIFAKVTRCLSSITCRAILSSVLDIAFAFPFTNVLTAGLVQLADFNNPATLEVREGGSTPTYSTGCAKRHRSVCATSSYQQDSCSSSSLSTVMMSRARRVLFHPYGVYIIPTACLLTLQPFLLSIYFQQRL